MKVAALIPKERQRLCGIITWGSLIRTMKRGGMNDETAKMREKRGRKMTYRVYVMDENDAVKQLLTYCLEQEGWQVTPLTCGADSLMKVADRPNLWILDADGEEGFKIMREVKRDSADSRVILTAEREKVVDRVLGLELGCDDFVVKPFSPREVVLRAKRILGHAKQETSTSQRLKLQDYWLDINRRMALYQEQAIDLTCKEFELLLLFARHDGMVLSRRQILRNVWGENYFGSERVVDDLVRRMRRKLQEMDVETLYGYGYRISS